MECFITLQKHNIHELLGENKKMLLHVWNQKSIEEGGLAPAPLYFF